MQAIRFLLPSLLLAGLLAGPLAAQQIGGGWSSHSRLDGPQMQAASGYKLASISDLDGDGVRELMVGTWLGEKNAPPGYWNPMGYQTYDSGTVEIYSGATGALLHRFGGQPVIGYAAMLGMSLDEAGDFNGDGVADLISGAPMDLGILGHPFSFGAAYVFTGAWPGPAILARLEGTGFQDMMGCAVAGLGDTNGDGYAEVVAASAFVSRSGMQHRGQVRVHSGPDGALLWEAFGPVTNAMLGKSVANVGDLNGDGAADLGVGVPGMGEVRVLDGATGSLLLTVPAPPGAMMFGADVDGGHDLDGDGMPDLLVGASMGAGSAAVFSGTDGHMILRVDGSPGDALGTSVRWVGDVDADGVPDFLAGSPTADRHGAAGTGMARLYSGSSGTLIHEWSGDAPMDHLGLGLTDMEMDVNGDGFRDFAIGAWGHDSAGGVWQTGSVWTCGFRPYLSLDRESISTSAGGILRMLADFGPGSAAVPYQLLLSLTGTGPTSVAGLDVPLSADGFFVKTLAGQYPAAMLRPMGLLDEEGRSRIVFPVPAGVYAGRAGSTLYAAVMTLPGGVPDRTSIARSLELLP